MTQSENKTFPTETNIQDLEGFIRTVTEAPDSSDVNRGFNPKKFSDQILLVTAGGSTAVYLFNIDDQTWRSVVIA